MLNAIGGSFLWRRLWQSTARRRSRPASLVIQIEHLECRTVLSGATAVIQETYRDFDFDITGTAHGNTVIPDGYWNGNQFVDYHDSYTGQLDPEFSSGSVSFSSATVGAGSAILRAARNEVLERRWFFGMMGVGV